MLEDLRHLHRLSANLRAAAELALVRAGLHSEVFEALRTPASAGEIAEQLHLDNDLLAAFLRAAHAHGLIQREGLRYQAGPYIRWLLDSQAADAAEAALDQTALSVLPVLARLPALLRGGERPEWGSAVQTARAARAARLTAARAQRALDKVPGVRQARHILDVGCGIGADLAAFLTTYRDAQGVGVERDPELAEQARETLHRAGVQRRGEILEGDFMSLEIARGSFDLVLLNHNLHYFAGAARLALFERIRLQLRRGGVLALQTPILAQSWISRATGFEAHAASLDLFLRAHGNLSGLPDPGALQAVLREVGFGEVGEVSIVPGGSLRTIWARADKGSG